MNSQLFIEEATSQAKIMLGEDSDPAVVDQVAGCIAYWMETGAQHARNEAFYRDLLDEVAKHLGPEVFVSDDGSVMEDPVRLKIPDMVGRLIDPNNINLVTNALNRLKNAAKNF